MSFHHVGLRVSSIERASRFYEEAFDGRVRTPPFVHEGAFAEIVMGRTPGARFRVCHVDIPAGTLELFELLDPRIPTGGTAPIASSLLHFGVQVDDVDAALARVEEAGGRRFFPEVVSVGAAGHAVYCTDLDGNIIELIDLTPDALIATLTAHGMPTGL